MFHMKEMEIQAKRLKYSGITLGAVLVTAFVLVQPTMQQANAVGIEGLPDYDNCSLNGMTPDFTTTTTTTQTATTTDGTTTTTVDLTTTASTTTTTTTTTIGQPE